MENELLQQQRVNDWKKMKSYEEKLIKLTAKLSPAEVKDVATNLHVTGSSLGAGVKAKEGSRHELELERQKRVESRSQKSGSRLTVTSSGTVTSLPETLQRIRREKSVVNGAAMLAATYPPRPGASGHQLATGSGHGVAELGQQCLDVSQVGGVKNTLQLPPIPQRTSSS